MHKLQQEKTLAKINAVYYFYVWPVSSSDALKVSPTFAHYKLFPTVQWCMRSKTEQKTLKLVKKKVLMCHRRKHFTIKMIENWKVKIDKTIDWIFWYLLAFKGQTIWQENCGFLNSPKNRTKLWENAQDSEFRSFFQDSMTFNWVLCLTFY